MPPSPMRISLFFLALAALCGLILFGSEPASGQVRFDFEQKYYVHPGHQTWDFSLVREDTLYHIFYHAVLDGGNGGAGADTIWHAVSPDLMHWAPPEPVVTSGQGAWDHNAVWAPDVFRDEAGDRWVMAYTGADTSMNQHLGLAWSTDLYTWTREVTNPVLDPDPALYLWGPPRTWSDFRDPFVWRENDQWHILLTAAQWLGERTGVLFHGTSDDLLVWQDVGPLFVHDGAERWRVLESSQYHVLGGKHHLLCGEFDTNGPSHISAAQAAGLTMGDRAFIGYGYAPELDTFDAGHHLLSRINPIILPNGTDLTYVVRIDTVHVSAEGDSLTYWQPSPLDTDWEIHTGDGAEAAPTFGANPLWRSEPHPGHVGHGWFGSGEYYMGPLSGYGFPGAAVGGSATCELLSRPFTVTGGTMDLRVGGGNDPDHLYVALVDAVTDSVLRRETGTGDAVMIARQWNLTDLAGRSCRIRIHDSATGIGDVINVDEIIETPPQAVAVAAPPRIDMDVRVHPNPANPRVQLSFRMERPGRMHLVVHDLRGRRVWSTAPRHCDAGPQRVVWHGRDNSGRSVASGTYLYVLTVDGRKTAVGKLSLVR